MNKACVVALLLILLGGVETMVGQDSKDRAVTDPSWELLRVEELSEGEIFKLRVAENRVAEYQQALLRLRTEIKKAHGASWESWMEWSGGTVVVLDGKKALVYKVFHSYMHGPLTFTLK